MNAASAEKGGQILSARIQARLSHPDPSSRPAMRRAGEAFSDGDARAIAPLIQALDGPRRRRGGGAGGAAQTGESGEKEKSGLGVRASP